jgi:hypothetical protein
MYACRCVCIYIYTHMHMHTHRSTHGWAHAYTSTDTHTHTQCIFVLCKTLSMDTILGVQTEDLKPNMQARVRAAWCDCDGVEVCASMHNVHRRPSLTAILAVSVPHCHSRRVRPSLPFSPCPSLTAILAVSVPHCHSRRVRPSLPFSPCLFFGERFTQQCLPCAVCVCITRRF